MESNRIFKPLLIFYVLVVYIFASFLWWFCLHLRNINQQMEKEITIMEKVYAENNLPIEDVKTSIAYDEAQKRSQSQRMMIIGEGAVFLLILIFGCYKIHSGIRKEILFNRQQRNFLLSITHELKSPLAGIKLSLETLINRKLDEMRQKKLLSNSMKDVERLRALVDNILMAARIENKSFSLANEEVNLSKLMNECVRMFNGSAGRNMQFKFAIEPGVFVKGDSTALMSVVINLIENAIKYSPAKSEISVALLANDEVARIFVRDTGIGITDEEKGKIFNKFYRVGNEDTRKAKGTGLGLYIVKELVDGHHGTIRVEDNEPQGTIFIVEFPCTKADTMMGMVKQKKAS